MIRTAVGIDYAGVSCVKITKGSRDPRVIDDSELSAFHYNSKWSKDVNVQGVRTVPYYGSTTSDGTFYAYASGAENDYLLSNAYFDGSLYNFPLFDHKEIDRTTQRFLQGQTRLSTRGYGDRGGRWFSGTYLPGGWFENYQTPYIPGHPNYGYTGVFRALAGSIDGFPSASPNIVVWRLPGDGTGIIDGAPQAPVAGQRTIEITPTACRVAKPGFSLTTATVTQIAFDSSKRPPKIVSSADIAVPSGVSAYDMGRVLPEGSVPDVYFYVAGDALYFPTDPTDFVKGAEYWISGQQLLFNNPNGACRARFIVIAGGSDEPTFGSNKVWRQFVENGQEVMQFLRPGAGQNPSFTDIILDSRWPSLQILSEGYIGVGGGPQQHVVPISATGMFPIVKYVTVHNGGGGSGATSGTSWSRAVRSPRVSRIGLFRAGWQQMEDAGDSTYCRVTSSEARFYTFVGSPVSKFYANLQAFDQNNPTHVYDTNPIIGIRYYVFGIPA
jgi:hypothetical protein